MTSISQKYHSLFHIPNLGRELLGSFEKLAFCAIGAICITMGYWPDRIKNLYSPRLALSSWYHQNKMEETRSKYIIIGAGLSGLTTAYQLFESGERDFVVLESRDRIGGRILTKNGIDFGATWFQNHHQNVIDLLNRLAVEKFYQYSTGRSILVYSTMAPEHYFESDPNAPSAHRISGNSINFINALATPFKNQIQTKQTVTKICTDGELLAVATAEKVFRAEKVIVTIPPRIATRIRYTPELPEEVIEAMEKTHTWMSNAIKVGLTFEKPFWRSKNLSGMLIGQVGTVTELYDHSNAQDNSFALMGFVNEGLRDFSAVERKERILDFLAKYLGDEVFRHNSYEEKDWSQDEHTSSETIKSIYMSPSYGNPLFANMYLNDKLLFSGAETSPVYGGYMDGAVYSGLKAANTLLQRNNAL